MKLIVSQGFFVTIRQRSSGSGSLATVAHKHQLHHKHYRCVANGEMREDRKTLLALKLENMGFLEERDLKNIPSIPEFFKGKSIFITGGSGFMGKILIEKLLYSCTDLERIYLLLRSKKGIEPNERLKSLYTVPCFDRLRKDRPGVFESKVSVVSGDISQPGLGLSTEDREMIIRKVNIVFHVAASVRFDDPLQVSAAMNMRSTIEVIEIAKEMKNLNVLVHVSTAYANSKWDPVEEAMYPPYADWRDTLNVCENMDEKTLQCFTPKYLGELPNTYVFTKQLAEQIVYEQKGKLPIIITRPSIVIASLFEPMPGWIENFNGPVGIIVGVGSGILRCLYSSKDFSGDFVPVDGCIKHFIAAAWIRGTKKLEPSDDIEIYNCCSRKRVTNGQLLVYGKETCTELPVENALWTLDCSMTTSKYFYYMMVFFVHVIPAIFVDTILRISGRKPRLLKLQRRIFTANMAVETFLLREWVFVVNNFHKLRSCLKKEDLQEFNYDFKDFMTKEHFFTCIMNGKRYLLKDKDENLPKAKAHMNRIIMADKIIRYAKYAFVVWAVIKYNFLQSIYQKII